MAETAAEICNLALLRVGVTAFIESLEDASEEGRVCKVVYPESLKAVLASFRWRFATRRAELAIIEDATRNGWSYVYALPADYVGDGPIWDGSEPRTLGGYPDMRTYEDYVGAMPLAPVVFTVEDDADHGKVLLANQATASISYVSNAVSEARFPPLFTQALAWHIAADLALALSKEPQLAMALQNKYTAVLRDAHAAEARQGQEGPKAQSSIISVRG